MSTNSSAPHTELPTRTAGVKREAEPAAATSVTSGGEPPAKRPYYGKCQYKTGKCFNERTLKRNGEAHSLCEEHRLKQNLIQRRSDRKYQTVHAIRRRERSQRRAVLKKQVSMAVAQQLFFEHQQQKTLGIPLGQHHPLHLLQSGNNTPQAGGSPVMAPSLPMNTGITLAPPIQVPASSPFMMEGVRNMASSHASLPLPVPYQQVGRRNQPEAASMTSVAALFKAEPILHSSSQTSSVSSKNEEATPTGIDDFAPESFFNMYVAGAGHQSAETETQASECGSECGSDVSDAFGFMPLVACAGERDTWSDDDIEFLQTVLLA